MNTRSLFLALGGFEPSPEWRCHPQLLFSTASFFGALMILENEGARGVRTKPITGSHERRVSAA
jgi:hypothetical protein